jgi:nucleotide-binding universal stress UspA family protein
MNAGIVVGIEGTPAGRAALEWAMREGMLRGRPVTVVHACGQPFGREVRAMSDVEARRASACMLDAAVAEAERAVGGKPEIIERSRQPRSCWRRPRTPSCWSWAVATG